jgi:hypothetical protein
MASETYLVLLAIETSSMSLSTLATRLAIEPSAGSHDRGARRTNTTTWEKTAWKLNSIAPEDAPLISHLESLLGRLPLHLRLREDVLPPDSDVCLCVGIQYEAEGVHFPSAFIPHRCLELLHRLGASIEVTCYPYRARKNDDAIDHQ